MWRVSWYAVEPTGAAVGDLIGAGDTSVSTALRRLDGDRTLPAVGESHCGAILWLKTLDRAAPSSVERARIMVMILAWRRHHMWHWLYLGGDEGAACALFLARASDAVGAFAVMSAIIWQAWTFVGAAVAISA